MTTHWRPDFDPEHLYFVTTSAANHAPIFRQPEVKRILLDAMHFVSSINKVSLYGFVVMPNHVHVIIHCPSDFAPKDWTRAFKSSTAQLVIRLYQVEQNTAALERLAAAVSRPEKQRYKVWEDGYLAKDIFSPAFLTQKLTYMHNNPTQPHWGLAEVPERYRWSSARYYLTEDAACLIPLHDARELLA